MGKEYTLDEALKLAIRTEKDSMDFYRKAGSMSTDLRCKRIFHVLANEEMGHLKAFLQHYQGGKQENLAWIMDAPPHPSGNGLARDKALERELTEQDALEIALQEEKACVELYTILAKDIVDPLVRRVFEVVIRESQDLYEMIED